MPINKHEAMCIFAVHYSCTLEKSGSSPCLLFQVRAGAEPRNLALGDPEVVEVGPAMFSIPQVKIIQL